MAEIHYHECICVICGELFRVEKAKKKRVICPTCNAAMQRGELQRPCEACGKPMVILSLHRRFCSSCLAARDRQRSRNFKREYVNRVYQKHTQIVKNSGCDACHHLAECQRLVWTTMPLRCQAKDLEWPGGVNPKRRVTLRTRLEV